MPLDIRWSQPAEQDLDAILSYIAFEDAQAARTLFSKLMEAIERAAEYPEIARRIPELRTDYRELISVRPFRVIYRLVGDELWIIGVMRMEQDFDVRRFV
ncbi:MAG: type II toxin-antitoxin system RelE/ParE family toxin [Holophagales bacterium]|jgi:toxin ParE1/3/4|nr:type II toxin-antitoxin system RelE/ParE family toxin [Holophagales bacterium]